MHFFFVIETIGSLSSVPYNLLKLEKNAFFFVIETIVEFRLTHPFTAVAVYLRLCSPLSHRKIPIASSTPAQLVIIH